MPGKLNEISKKLKNFDARTFSNIIGISFLIFYTILFFYKLSPFWFNPNWTTDDALQQVFPFHSVFDPEIFKGDIVTESMLSYLAPAHYWLCYAITWLCGDPIMMAHWVMLIQVAGTAIFIYLLVYHAAGVFPACFATVWFLHARHLIQRLTGGLPRGWMSPVCAIYLFLVYKKKHTGILFFILFCCFLNSLSAFVIIVCEGSYLLWRVLNKNSRTEYSKRFIRFLLACPIYLIITVFVVRQPDYIGKMVTYKEALTMPELSRDEGRFKIAPLQDPLLEIDSLAFQAINTDFHRGTPKFVKKHTAAITLSILLIILLVGFARKIKPFPLELAFFIGAAIFCYFASRLLAFNLYIPGRYVRFPFSIFFITAISIGLWNVFQKTKLPNQNGTAGSLLSHLALIMMGGLIFLGGGAGFSKNAGFNYERGRDGNIYEWFKKHTPKDITIAGYPSIMDPVQLFAVRKAYISNETAHPFYDKYYALVKERLAVSLRAHFAKNAEEFLNALGTEKIDYFVFERRRFYPDKLSKPDYFMPFEALIKDLTGGDVNEYFYRSLPEKVDMEKYPFMPFRDRRVAVIDVKALRDYLAKSKTVSAN